MQRRTLLKNASFLTFTTLLGAKSITDLATKDSTGSYSAKKVAVPHAAGCTCSTCQTLSEF